jgi:hypothetical protein
VLFDLLFDFIIQLLIFEGIPFFLGEDVLYVSFSALLLILFSFFVGLGHCLFLFESVDAATLSEVFILPVTHLEFSRIRLLWLASLVLFMFEPTHSFGNHLLVPDFNSGIRSEGVVHLHDDDISHLEKNDLEEHFLADVVNVQLLKLNYFVGLVQVLDFHGPLASSLANFFDLVLRLVGVNAIGEDLLLGVFGINMRARYDLVMAKVLVDVIQLHDDHFPLLLVNGAAQNVLAGGELAQRVFF